MEIIEKKDDCSPSYTSHCFKNNAMTRGTASVMNCIDMQYKINLNFDSFLTIIVLMVTIWIHFSRISNDTHTRNFGGLPSPRKLDVVWTAFERFFFKFHLNITINAFLPYTYLFYNDVLFPHICFSFGKLIVVDTFCVPAN